MQEAQQLLEVVSPYDQALIRRVPLQNEAAAEGMLDTAVDRFNDRDGWLEHHERIAAFNRLAGLVEAEADDFAHLIASEGGKPLVDARVEVARAIDGIHLAVVELPHVTRGEEVPMGHTGASQAVPRTPYTSRSASSWR